VTQLNRFGVSRPRTTPGTTACTTRDTTRGMLLALILFVIATATPAASRFTDLRRIEPIHGDAAAGAQKAAVCLACHGANGVSVAPTFPRLAGQRADYLYHRLVSFKHADSKDPYYSKSPMTAIAATLSDEDARNLATYFSAQVPQVADVPTAPASAQRGAALFYGGDPSHGVPPCQGCHGAAASGVTSRANQYLAYPSLRGQYGPYVIARLTNFRAGLPSDTSNDFIMAGVARTLDDESIQAIAAWISSLTPTGSL
jgi:cytochrome c553